MFIKNDDMLNLRHGEAWEKRAFKFKQIFGQKNIQLDLLNQVATKIMNPLLCYRFFSYVCIWITDIYGMEYALRFTH